MQDRISKKRTIKDILLQIVTYFSSSFSIICLLGILIYVLVTGASSLDFRMLTGDYYENPSFATVIKEDDTVFDLQDNNGVYYSLVWGIGLQDSNDLEGNACVLISYIDEKSPLNNAKNQTTQEPIKVSVGQMLKRVQMKTDSGNLVLTAKQGSQELAKKLDLGKEMTEFYYSSMGGGIRGSLITTLYLILLTLVIALPIGTIAAIYLANYTKDNAFTKIIRTLIDMIGGIPSIFFGLIGVIIFIPFVSNISGNSGGSIISGALTMSIMLLPTIIKNTEEAINNIPKGYKMSALSLGASETQTTFKIILPNAIPGILTGVLLSIGRIIGESAALIFAIGTAIQDDISLTKGSTTLAVHIWTVMSGENPNYAQACAISIIILIVVLVLNITVKLVCKKMNRFEVK